MPEKDTVSDDPEVIFPVVPDPKNLVPLVLLYITFVPAAVNTSIPKLPVPGMVPVDTVQVPVTPPAVIELVKVVLAELGLVCFTCIYCPVVIVLFEALKLLDAGVALELEIAKVAVPEALETVIVVFIPVISAYAFCSVFTATCDLSENPN